MQTTAVRLYGPGDLRLETFSLPAIQPDEILVRVVCDSICMSTYKAVIQGSAHKRVPADIAENPIITGHEFCGEIVEVGAKWQDKYRPGQKFAVQPAMKTPDLRDPGYSFCYCGGDATYAVLPPVCMEKGCLLTFENGPFFAASLSEPLACVCCAAHSMYHTHDDGSYGHDMGIREGGRMVMMASVGPMGLAAIDYILHTDRRPSLLVITDIDGARLARASRLLTVAEAAKQGVELHYLNTRDIDAKKVLMELSGGKGYDDAVVFAPVPAVVELADSVLAVDGCLNFFSGPADHAFAAKVNFYNVHYAATHICGSAGSSAADMQECLDMISAGKLTPAVLVTHIGGLGCAAQTTLNLPQIPGGKKVIYTHVDLPLTAVDDFAKLGKTDPFFAHLAELTAKTGGLWNAEAEAYLLQERSAD